MLEIKLTPVYTDSSIS